MINNRGKGSCHHDTRRNQRRDDSQNGNQNKKLSLYIHIPFCIRKCYYCDFLSAAATEEIRAQYVYALQRELELQASKYREYHVDSVFIGGGTPSILSATHMETIMQTVMQNYQILPDVEVSIEVNPGTVDEEKLICYQKLGINRLSIGLQSANNEELCQLGRIHTYETFLHTYETARQVGYRNINIDLMSGLPGQTLKTYGETLQKIIELDPEHISAYSLIIEEGTPFWETYGEGNGKKDTEKNKPAASLPDEDVERGMYELTRDKLEQAGYHRYEISNYAKKGYESRHNMGYWRRHHYLGLGLGASSLVENQRWKNTSDLNYYIEEKGNVIPQETEILTIQDQMEEFMFLGLRLMKGITYEDFQSYFHMPIQQVYDAQIKKGIQDGLLMECKEEEKTFLRLTSRGIDVSNVVMAEFLF